MKKITAIILFVSTSILSLSPSLTAQDPAAPRFSENEADRRIQFSMYAELVSQYVWRGLQLHPEANIQPGLTLAYKNLSLGLWTSSALASPFTEADLAISYAFPAFTVNLTDYYAVNKSYINPKDFFHYANKEARPTGHALEFSIITNGLPWLPLNITAATFFYGNDLDESGKNLYSSYLEAAYTREWKDYRMTCFFGGTINESFYAAKASFTNVGIRLIKELQINQLYNLSLNSGLVYNPNSDELYFIFGLGI